MATDRKTKTPDNADSTPWVVKGTTGKVVPTNGVKNETFPGFKDAATAAHAYTRETGLFAQAVRQ